MPKFTPGTRVILHGYFNRSHIGPIGGTVIATMVDDSIPPTRTLPPALLLHVIFDDGTQITAGQNNFWLESEYDPKIPF